MANEFAALKPVDSSMFSRAGYDEGTWTLLLEFKSTREIRAYKNVSPEMGDEVLSAPSLGKFFNSQIKGNPGWEFDVLGADPSQEAPAPKAKAEPEVEGGITDADIRRAEPGWTGTTILSTDHIHKEYGGIDRGQVAIEPSQDFGVKEYDPQTGCWPSDAVNVDGTVKEEAIAALTKQTEGEILGAWTAPQSAAEALDLMAERDSEIKAIIAQSKSTGDQALTVRVTDTESHAKASETLTKLVAKKDKTVSLLEPFRAVLYAVYEEAAGYKKQAVEPLEKGERHIKTQIVSWKNEQERLRQAAIREENERRDAEARRLQEEEAQRIKLADVQDAIDAGDEKGAQTLFDAPPIQVPRPYVPPVYVPPAAPKVEGQSSSTTWKVDRDLVESDESGQAYVASITKLLAAVKNGVFPIEQAAPLLSWDFAACDKLAGAMMSAFSVPGLQAGPATTLRVSRGRKKKA